MTDLRAVGVGGGDERVEERAAAEAQQHRHREPGSSSTTSVTRDLILKAETIGAMLPEPAVEDLHAAVLVKEEEGNSEAEHSRHDYLIA